jgi:acyl-CoA synthetase (AMP-forming)/AMP-acid ligase II
VKARGRRRKIFIAWAREHTAPYKVPAIVEFVTSLPRSATGKVQWRVLQEEEQRKPQPA